MVELIGDICVPSELIAPAITVDATNQPKISGAIYMSGAELFFYNGSAATLIA